MKLTPELEDILVAAMDRIIPADEYPSASVNGCLKYIYRLIDRDETGATQYIYEEGLAALETEAQVSCGRSFTALKPDVQDAVLAEVELGVTHTHWPLPTDEFFVSLVRHVTEGYYCAPEQGGNPDGASWRMVGFDNRTGMESA